MAGKFASSPAPPGRQADALAPGASPTASAEQPPTRHVPPNIASTTMTNVTNAPNATGAPDATIPTPQAKTPTAVAGRAQRQRRPSWLARGGAIALPTLVGVALLLLWQGATQSGAVSPYLLPTPGAVAQSLLFSLRDGLLTTYGLTTLQESLTGLALGALVALPLGYALARSRWIAAALEPYLAATQAVPAVALAPLMVLWLGYGLPPVAALCALIVFFPMVVNTTLGIRRLDRDVLDAARVDGAGRWAFLWRIEAPLAAPVILAGIRTSVTLSVTGAVVGEFVLGDQGLGGLLTIARGSFDTPLVFATLLMLALLTAALYGCARTVEWLYSRWEA